MNFDSLFSWQFWGALLEQLVAMLVKKVLEWLFETFVSVPAHVG